MLTIAPRERHDCPTCGSVRMQMIARGRVQVVLRCMDCRGWLAIGEALPGDDSRHAAASDDGRSVTIVAGARSSVG